MKRLSKTSKYGIGRGSHYHIYYLNDENQKGVIGVSGAPAHSHELIYQEAQPEQPEVPPSIDPMTGQMIQGTPYVPAIPGGWIVQPGGMDGHTHTLEEVYEITAQQEEESESEVVRDVLNLFRTASEIESESFKKAMESEDFYVGKQWRDADKQALSSMDRACLTINVIAPKIDEISGHQRQTRTQIHYVPVETGDQKACDLYNIVANAICTQSNYDREKSKVFMDQIIPGRGNINLYVDFSTNIFGDIKIEKYPWKNVRYGPHEHDDLSDCEYLCKFRKYSLGKLKVIAPDKYQEIKQDFEMFRLEGERHVVYAGDNYARGDESRSKIIIGDQVMVDIAKKEYTLVECWRKVWIDTSVAVEGEDEFVESMYGWDPKDIKQIETMPGFVVIKRTQPKMRITKIAGGVLISDENPADLPVDDFFLIPAYASRRDFEWWGKVEAAKDPQREVNKRRSQAIDIANKMGANGWGYDDSTFPDENEAQRFRRNSTSPGFVVKLNNVNAPPHKFDGLQFPGEMVQLMQMDLENLDRILNISTREPGANTSAAAILQAQKMKLIGNEFLFDNLQFAERKLGLLLIHTIRKYYSPERIYRLVANINAKKEVEVGGEPFDNFTYEEIKEIIENADITKFDVAVTESSYSPTAQMGVLMVLQEWASSGGPVPPKLLVEHFDAPEDVKKKMIADIDAQAAAQSQATQGQADAQIEMTLAGKGIFTPRVKAMIGGEGEGQPQQDPNASQQQEPAPVTDVSGIGQM